MSEASDLLDKARRLHQIYAKGAMAVGGQPHEWDGLSQGQQKGWFWLAEHVAPIEVVSRPSAPQHAAAGLIKASDRDDDGPTYEVKLDIRLRDHLIYSYQCGECPQRFLYSTAPDGAYKTQEEALAKMMKHIVDERHYTGGAQ